MAFVEPPGGVDTDPFAPTPFGQSHRHRYAGFDNDSFSLYSNGSPAQAKRALEAHLAETERRLQEASQLGSSLLEQRGALSEKLKEVQERQDDDDIGPELRRKLYELEREFNEVGKETARAFIPKSRVPSNESAASTEPSVLEIGTRDSPSKVQPPSLSSRKQRNAAPSRMNDIKLATEISSSLLNQIRDLQAAYAEKDDALRAAQAQQSSLEAERESLFQRLRSMDESEQRYKDENWTLETRLQELSASTKAAAERENKLQQAIKAAQFEKSDVEKELEELKQAHGKLNDDHTATRKQHDAELTSLRKDASLGESDRAALQRKIDELSAQNQELAQAMAYKLRQHDSSTARELTPEDDDADLEGQVTPEHSPPPSPTKGTPRHGGLESETLKSSLHHAHRMIQNLKNNIHREKTEKSELRRMLQNAQDELEHRRSENGNSAAKKRKSRDELKDFKKPARPDRLGGARGATSEIFVDDEWEDHDGPESPSHAAARKAALKGGGTDTESFKSAPENDNSDDFETATEHERETESEAFHTGAESLDGDSSGDQTETEDKRPALSVVRSKKSTERRTSFQSTASTDDDFDNVRTPSQPSAAQKFKIRLGRGHLRNRSSRSSQILADSPAGYRDSPASVASGGSNRSAPSGPSLFAELGDLSGSEDEENDTPSRSAVTSRDVTPEVQRKTPLRRMEAAEEPKSEEHKGLLDRSRDVLGAAVAGGVGFALGRRSNSEAQEDYTPDKLGIESLEEPSDTVSDVLLSLSEIQTQETEPVEVFGTPTITQAPTFTHSGIAAQDTVPETPVKKEKDMPALTASTIAVQDTEPLTPAKVTGQVTPLTLSTVVQQYAQEPVEPSSLSNSAAVAPMAVQDTKSLTPDKAISSETELALSTVVEQYTQEPVEPLILPPDTGVTPVGVQDAKPLTPAKFIEPATPLALSTVVEQYALEPVEPSILPNGAAAGIQDPNQTTVGLRQPTQTLPGVEPERPSTAKRVAPDAGNETIPPLPSGKERLPTAFQEDQKQTQGSDSRKPAEYESSKPSLASKLGFTKAKAARPHQIAEDETRTPDKQPLKVYSDDIDDGGSLPGLEHGRTPFREIEPNVLPERATKEGAALAKSFASPKSQTADEGTQTMFSSEDFDKFMKKRAGDYGTAVVSPATSSPTRLPRSPTAGVYRPTSPLNRSRESVIAVDGSTPRVPRRPGSSGSVRSRTATPPPLPADHKEAIAAAAQKVPPTLSPGTPGSMGPPMMPASAYRTSQQYRPGTANSNRGAYGTARIYARGGLNGSGVSSPVTRRSSVSSFASEIDQRFNISADGRNLGFDPTVDPRMIQAITQTMIGEFLWKYTRKPGREAVSTSRHRRFFWVHPYTRTLYWSEQDPASAGRSQLKAKSVKIQSVRVVSDDNPHPPGLHGKSLVVTTPGREIQFTAATGGRHEMWFNSLSYLLLRTDSERSGETGDENGITAEDVDEFNPRTVISKMTRQSGASLSSYHSRTTRNSRLSDYPTLTPNDRQTVRAPSTVRRSQSAAPAVNTPTQTQRGSMSGRLSSFAGSIISGSFASRYSGIGGQYARQNHDANEDGPTAGHSATVNEERESSIYDASVVRSSHDSAEELRRVIEKQEREADRLENVRACCDGKHDVGSLSHASRRGRHASHRHSTTAIPRTQSHNTTGTVHSRRESHPLSEVASEA